MTKGSRKPPPRVLETGRKKAVALSWDRRHAPRVTAAGVGLQAEEILRLADAHDVPLQSEPWLAEALSQIPVGQEVPPALYIAVAEVLAFVFTLAGIDPRDERRAADPE